MIGGTLFTQSSDSCLIGGTLFTQSSDSCLIGGTLFTQSSDSCLIGSTLFYAEFGLHERTAHFFTHQSSDSCMIGGYTILRIVGIPAWQNGTLYYAQLGFPHDGMALFITHKNFGFLHDGMAHFFTHKFGGCISRISNLVSRIPK
jgi:hypothetical protein